MSRFISAATAAFALANLYLLVLTGPLVSPRHDLIFHLPGSATALFLPVLLDLLALWIVLDIVLWSASRRPTAETVVWAALLFPVPSVIIATAAVFLGVPTPRSLSWTVGGLALASFVLVLLRPAWSRVAFARLRPFLSAVLASLAAAGVLLLLQLLWFGWQSRALNPPFVSRVRASRVSSPGSPHVLWIILDELAFDQVYGHRPPGLALPNFDRLGSTASVFTHAVPTAEYTRIAVPALLTGLPIRRAKPSADGRGLALSVAGEDARRRPFDGGDTVFGDAVRGGLSTGVAGWYEPYCRLLPHVLDRCFWTYSDEIPGGMSTGASIGRNAVEPLRLAILDALHAVGLGPGAPDAGASDVRRHGEDYRALLAAGDTLLSDAQPNLVLLHMPIPHPWGFFDRRRGTFPNYRTSYLDNLALADLYLGHIRALLEAKGTWDTTDIVIMGDHSWRTSLVWQRSGFWTAEEQAASRGGAFDDRPAVIVKLHNQRIPAEVNAPFQGRRTRALLDALLGRKLATPEDLKRWVGETGPAAPAD